MFKRTHQIIKIFNKLNTCYSKNLSNVQELYNVIGFPFHVIFALCLQNDKDWSGSKKYCSCGLSNVSNRQKQKLIIFALKQMKPLLIKNSTNFIRFPFRVEFAINLSSGWQGMKKI